MQTEVKLIQEPIFRPYISAEYCIKNVKYKLDKISGYTTKIDCKLFKNTQAKTTVNVANITSDTNDTIDLNAQSNALCNKRNVVIYIDDEDIC
ncbi:hypothetical protein [Bartonella taylorii]|uniref:hypothetical protein n=1 Tax=Bartonella taylorii TaxID=33046 RepID=UPI001ABB5D78|nr:hypothetical protein [Bartonella taylorii]